MVAEADQVVASTVKTLLGSTNDQITFVNNEITKVRNRASNLEERLHDAERREFALQRKIKTLETKMDTITDMIHDPYMTLDRLRVYVPSPHDGERDNHNEPVT